MVAGTFALSVTACSSGKDKQAQAAMTPHDVTLTAAQQKSIELYQVAKSQYHTTLDTNGVVDFDHDQSTSILAPFSGPVTRLLVTLGQKVHKGQALATVASPDFAAVADAYRKALAAAHAADLLAATDRDLASHHAISQRENAQTQAESGSADAERDAPLQPLRRLRVASPTMSPPRHGQTRCYLNRQSPRRSPPNGTQSWRRVDMATPESVVSPEPAPAPTPPPAPRRGPWKLIAVIVVVIVALSAVAAYVVLSTPTTAPPSVVTYATNSEMVTLDPSSEFSNSILLLPNVYETLTTWNPATNTADPLLATSWTHSSDGLTWNFTLRQGVTFHDGTAFDAAALRFAIDRTVYMNQGAAYIWYPLMGAGAYFTVSATAAHPWTTPEWTNFTADAITIVDANHVTFHLDYPAALDKIASSGYGAYMFSPNTPPTTATGGNLTARFDAQQSWFNDQHHDAGSGPYALNTTQYSNSYVVLDKYANYWGGWQANQFDHAVIKVIPDQIQREQAVTSGAADITEDVPLQDIPTLQNNTGVKVLQTPSYRALYAFFNMAKSPTSNLSVRKALAYALPYQDMVTTVVKGLGSQSIGVVPATMWGHDGTLPHYTENLALAQQWLSTSPHPHGGFTLTHPYGPGAP